MDTSTSYLGLRLPHPFIAGASPMGRHLDGVKRLEDAGCAAVVLHSIFEEQITQSRTGRVWHMDADDPQFAETLSHFPAPSDYSMSPDGYAAHVSQVKAAVGIPVIASMNGSSAESWLKYAKVLEQAGADALELNIYYIPTDLDLPGIQVEQMYMNVVEDVKKSVRIPVAIKLGPYFSNMAHMARRLCTAGADGLVLFNRFYQPDIDLEQLEVVPNVLLSTPQAMRLPLRWIAILYGRIEASLAATSGIHSAEDAIKMFMAGADVTMLCSTLLRNGVGQIRRLEQDLVRWMEEHEYDSVRLMKGSLSQKSCAHPAAFERANYMKALKSYV